MSSAGASTTATLLPATLRLEQGPDGDHLTVEKRISSKQIVARTLQPPRRIDTPKHVSPSWRSVAHTYNDPCNYLG
jgi:hypothetical protein